MRHLEQTIKQPEAIEPFSPMTEQRIEMLSDKILEGIQQGATFKDMYDISSDAMEAIYAHAYDFYQQGRLNEAESLFRLLCIYDFHNADYALGLGAVFQLKKHYSKALDVFALAYTLSGGDSRAMLYAGECNLLLRRLGKAKRCFESVLEGEADARLKSKAEGYLEAINSASGEAAQTERREVT